MRKQDNDKLKKKKQEEIIEDVQIYGPEDLYNLSVEQILGLFPGDVAKEKPKKKVPSGFEHYYTENPTSELIVRELELELRNGHFYKFKSPSGVYGTKKVDRASQLLIDYAEIEGKKLLDIGCGYGPIGITLKKENPFIEVFMSDINKRAVEFSKINAKDNNALIEIKQGNLYEPWKEYKFDMIVSNPPIVAGKSIWQNLIKEAKDLLNPNGTLQLVAFHNKGGSRISEYMEEVFGNVVTIVKSGGARVYRSVNE